MPCQTAFASMIRTTAAAVALFVMLLSGLVPSGWMPLARAGSVELVICTGAGVITRTVDLGDGQVPAPADQHGKSGGACLFAGLGQAGQVPADVASPEIARISTAPPSLPVAHSIESRTAYDRLPPSQGPPLFV